jgi:hypothetical protein
LAGVKQNHNQLARSPLLHHNQGISMWMLIICRWWIGLLFTLIKEGSDIWTYLYICGCFEYCQSRYEPAITARPIPIESGNDGLYQSFIQPLPAQKSAFFFFLVRCRRSVAKWSSSKSLASMLALRENAPSLKPS